MLKHLTLIILVCLCSLLPAQQAETPVPVAVKNAFVRDFPQQIGEWSKDGDLYRVKFTDRNSKLDHVVVYDTKGNLVKRDEQLRAVPQETGTRDQKTYPAKKSKGSQDQKDRPSNAGTSTFSPVNGEKNSGR